MHHEIAAFVLCRTCLHGYTKKYVFVLHSCEHCIGLLSKTRLPCTCVCVCISCAHVHEHHHSTPHASMPFSRLWGRTFEAHRFCLFMRTLGAEPGPSSLCGSVGRYSAHATRQWLVSHVHFKLTWLACVHHPPTGAYGRHVVHRDDDLFLSVYEQIGQLDVSTSVEVCVKLAHA